MCRRDRAGRPDGELACGDFDGDGFDDVLAHTPGEEVGTTLAPDYTTVLFGSSAGLTGTQDLFR